MKKIPNYVLEMTNFVQFLRLFISIYCSKVGSGSRRKKLNIAGNLIENLSWHRLFIFPDGFLSALIIIFTHVSFCIISLSGPGRGDPGLEGGRDLEKDRRRRIRRETRRAKKKRREKIRRRRSKRTNLKRMGKGTMTRWK
jgi:uncharacterized membrane protein